MNKKIEKALDFEDVLKEDLKDPEFKKWFDYYGKQLEVSLAILRLRKKNHMTQAQMAKKLGTSQSNVARLERGQQNFTVEFLDKIATVFNKELKISFR
ncbi:MAG: helix-turn-helix transcriptional regulator [Candidatus Komeilibacteria bacterium]|nr:helix-turn-helix transcriptional regulator [Candidatus Komeilibacteria bacterium]